MSKKNIVVSGTKDFVEFYKGLKPNEQLKKYINEAMDLLKSDPTIGDRIEKQLWPKEYRRKYGINNLFRYQLPSGYRMIYTIIGDSSKIVCLIIEVLPHKEYDKLFGYKTS